MGYTNFTQILNSKNFGVPQNRERVFMVSILGDAWFDFPKPFQSDKKLKDLLDENVDDRYYLSQRCLSSFIRKNEIQREKGNGFTFKPTNGDCIAKTITTHPNIWGGNYYKLLPCQCFIFWYKQNPVPNFSDGEFAWTNFNCPAKCFGYRYYGNLQGKSSVKEKKIHPTQKPIILYEWLLQNFAELGQRILDTHGGSMSHAIAAHKLGFDLTIIEKDPVYYEQAKKRLIEFQRQQVLF